MAKKIAETQDENVLDLGQFMSRQNEEKGVWTEIVIDNPKNPGEKIETGIEVKLYGPNSKVAAKINASFNEENDELQKLPETTAEEKIEKNEKFEVSFAKRVAGFVADIRAKNGKKLVVNGKEPTVEDAFDIFYNAPSFLIYVYNFIRNQNNFIGIK